MSAHRMSALVEQFIHSKFLPSDDKRHIVALHITNPSKLIAIQLTADDIARPCTITSLIIGGKENIITSDGAPCELFSGLFAPLFPHHPVILLAHTDIHIVGDAPFNAAIRTQTLTLS